MSEEKPGALLNCRVRQELQNAANNGEHFTGWSHEDIANDLISYSSEFDHLQRTGAGFEQLAKAVEQVFAEGSAK